jgi:hypothetical protein
MSSKIISEQVFIPSGIIVHTADMPSRKLVVSYEVTTHTIDTEEKTITWKNSFGGISWCHVDDGLLSYNVDLYKKYFS